MKIQVTIHCTMDGPKPDDTVIADLISRRVSGVIMSEAVDPADDSWAIMIDAVETKVEEA